MEGLDFTCQEDSISVSDIFSTHVANKKGCLRTLLQYNFVIMNVRNVFWSRNEHVCFWNRKLWQNRESV